MINISKLVEIIGGRGKIINGENCSILLIEDTKTVFCRDEVVPVIEAVRIIAADGFGVEVESQSTEGIKDHLINVSACAFICINEIMGFASVKVFEELNILFLHGIAMRTDCQSKGLGKMLLQEIIKFYPKSMIAFTTQNPVMYDVLSGLCGKVYPSPQNPYVPDHLQKIGNSLMAGRIGKFDERIFVSRELYQKCLYTKIPQSRNYEVDQWFMHTLNMDSRITRDGFLFIGE